MRRRFINSAKSVSLSFEALEDGLSISFFNDILYRINGGAWETLLAGENTEEVNKGSVISFQHASSIMGFGGVGQFYINKKCNVFGACSSIIPKSLGEKYMAPYLFSTLFYNCDTIVDASKLELPATTLAEYCYYGMFEGCTSLTTAPELPATTLANNCYREMFSGCTKLNYIKMLATDISAVDCLYYWVNDVASSGTFVKNPAMNSLPTATSSNSYAGIPSGWTVVNDGEENKKTDNFVSIEPSGTRYNIIFEHPCDVPLKVYLRNWDTLSVSVPAGTSSHTLGRAPETPYIIDVEPQSDSIYNYTW